jgi:hypothetical protein
MGDFGLLRAVLSDFIGVPLALVSPKFTNLKGFAMDIFRFDLTEREAQVIYMALSRMSFTGVDDNAQALIRYKLDKIFEEKTGQSISDRLEVR